MAGGSRARTPAAPPGAYDGAPYLGELRDAVLYGDLWERPQLSKRDRSLVTVAVNQALYRTDELRTHLRRALDNGLTQDEIAELITHVAFYSGWPTGVNASRVAAEVFRERGLPPAALHDSPRRDPAAQPAVPTPAGFYEAAPYLGVLRNEVLFGDVWERPQLSKRDRCLATVAVTQALYYAEEMRLYVMRSLDNGVTPQELAEAITHITFYSGWPTGVNASRVAAAVFRERGLELPPPHT
jgi:4-carboxymuconolactone decarboxylase